MFRRKPSSTTTRNALRKAVGGILLTFVMAWIAGCQGVSSGPPAQRGNLSLASSALNFGSVAPGISKTLMVSATNSGNAPVNISAAAISSKYFALTSPTLPAALAAGQSVSLTFSFTPNAAGTFDALATIASDASSAVPNLSLTGTGVADGRLAPSATSEAFGSVIVGSSRSLTEVITNAGGSSVTVSQVTVSGVGFSFSGMSVPVSLAAGQSASIDVSFAPKSSGGVSGSLFWNLGNCGTDFSKTSCIVSSASSRCPQTHAEGKDGILQQCERMFHTRVIPTLHQLHSLFNFRAHGLNLPRDWIRPRGGCRRNIQWLPQT